MFWVLCSFSARGRTEAAIVCPQVRAIGSAECLCCGLGLPTRPGARNLSSWQVAVFQISDSNEPVPGDFLPKHVAVKCVLPRTALSQSGMRSSVSASSASRKNNRAKPEPELQENTNEDHEGEDEDDDDEDDVWQDVLPTWDISDDEFEGDRETRVGGQPSDLDVGAKEKGKQIQRGRARCSLLKNYPRPRTAIASDSCQETAIVLLLVLPRCVSSCCAIQA